MYNYVKIGVVRRLAEAVEALECAKRVLGGNDGFDMFKKIIAVQDQIEELAGTLLTPETNQETKP